jgi:hypothetical protein
LSYYRRILVGKNMCCMRHRNFSAHEKLMVFD